MRNCGKAGHIEDVVVDASARGMHLGKKVIDYLTNYAEAMGCYKVKLDCSPENTQFYEKCVWASTLFKTILSCCHHRLRCFFL